MRWNGEWRPLVKMTVIDAHQHFWDLGRNYLPWLCDEPPIAFRYGSYEALKRDYLPTDYLRDTRGFRIAGSVFVETEWDRADPVGETRWVAALRETAELPSAMVCHVALDRPDAADTLVQQASFPFVRGVRHKPAKAIGSMADPAWRRGYARLAEHEMSFDLQTPWQRLPEAAALNREVPETLIVLNHSGLPADRSLEGLAGWREAMQTFAAAPNVAVKISGLGEPGRPWSLKRNRDIILAIIDMFGVERCMFASNFPVDSLVGDFHTIFSGYAEATAPMGHEVQAQLFADNARRLYRLDDPAKG